MNLRCSAHGLLPWLGQGECSSCGKVYKHILQAPETCTCGARLMPYGKGHVVEILFAAKESSMFSARPMCSKCFESAHRIAEAETLPPDD